MALDPVDIEEAGPKKNEKGDNCWGLWNLLTDNNDEEANTAEKLSYLSLFALFLSFGARAFGGPAAQIAMMKQASYREGYFTSYAILIYIAPIICS